MCPDLFLVEAPCGSILISDHSVFAFGVVAYGRFDCIHIKPPCKQNLLLSLSEKETLPETHQS